MRASKLFTNGCTKQFGSILSSNSQSLRTIHLKSKRAPLTVPSHSLCTQHIKRIPTYLQTKKSPIISNKPQPTFSSQRRCMANEPHGAPNQQQGQQPHVDPPQPIPPIPTTQAIPRKPNQAPPVPSSQHVLPSEAVVEAHTPTYDRRERVHSYEAGEMNALVGKKLDQRNDYWLHYLIAMGLFSLGMAFMSVPLYQAFCQMTGSGGTVRRDQQIDELNRYMQRTKDLGDVTLRPITVTFQATTDPNLPWTFIPCQKDITLRIGETALAFFHAKNNSSKPIIGVSSYNVLPPQAGLYFNKIQCFCFDEQRLRAGEEIDMPVFFFLDPAMADDWRMDNVDDVTLCYTFFEVEADNDGDAELDNANPLQTYREAVEVVQLNNYHKNPAISAHPNIMRSSAPLVLASSQNTSDPVTSSSPVTPSGPIIGRIGVPMDTIPGGNVNTSTPVGSTSNDKPELICPVIPPTAMHNPSGKSLYKQ